MVRFYNKLNSENMIIIDCKIDSFPVIANSERTHIEYDPTTDKLVVESNKQFNEDCLRKFLNLKKKIDILLNFRSEKTSNNLGVDGERGTIVITVGDRSNTIFIGQNHSKLPISTPWNMSKNDHIIIQKDGKLIGIHIPYWEDKDEYCRKNNIIIE